MKQVWNVFVFLGYIYGTDKLLLTRAEVKTLDLSTRDSNITCGGHAVIRIDNVTVHAHESYCSINMSNECLLSDDDYRSIGTRCNNTHNCTIEYPKNTSCFKQDRYFNFKYSCLVPTNLLCTFEYHLCVWKNEVVAAGNLQWRIYSARRSNTHVKSNLPIKDHTTNSRNGTYLYLQKEGDLRSATLKSGNFSFDKGKCLVLWYKMDDSSSLEIYTPDSNFNELKQINGTLNSSWEFISINIPFVDGEPSEITIIGKVGSSNNAYIALDDIDIQGWECNNYLPVSCHFEKGLCNFKKLPKQQGNEEWDLIRALKGEFGRPPFDHTNGHGFYMYTTSNHQNPVPRRVIIISFDIGIEVRCLSLWYYKYGDTPGHLNIYTMVDDNEEILYSMIDRRTQFWSQYQANVYNAQKIILEYNFTDANQGGIALDDIYISPIRCADEKTFSNACKKKDVELNIRCPVSNVLKEEFAFDLNKTMSCTTTSKQIENILQQTFRTYNKTATCKFTPAVLVKDDNCFYMPKQLQLTYSCIKSTETTTPKPKSEPTISTSPQKDAITSIKLTQTVSSTPQTEAITESLQSDSSSSTPVTGIVVGVVLSLVALSVILVIAFIYFKRTRYAEKKGHSIVANEDSHTDYTGHQNTAFSPEVNVTTQTDYCEIRTSKHNDQYHDITDTFSPSISTTNDDEYSEIANVINSQNNPNASINYQHQYITLDPNATGFDRSNHLTKLHNESKNKHHLNETPSFTGGDDYAILDPDDINESKNNTPKVFPLSENYVVLDPTETGFNRQENTDTVCNYELATPINPTETSEDPYDVSKDETYDTSSNSRHKEKDDNIYSHMVDNVYDTAGNQRKKEANDGTYDHFFGQQSEDDYDISKPF